LLTNLATYSYIGKPVTCNCFESGILNTTLVFDKLEDQPEHSEPTVVCKVFDALRPTAILITKSTKDSIQDVACTATRQLVLLVYTRSCRVCTSFPPSCNLLGPSLVPYPKRKKSMIILHVTDVVLLLPSVSYSYSFSIKMNTIFNLYVTK
jgi:hypothetical protein